MTLEDAWIRISHCLGKPINQCKKEITSSQLISWMQYLGVQDLEPIGMRIGTTVPSIEWNVIPTIWGDM